LRRIQSEQQRLDDLARRAERAVAHRVALDSAAAKGLGQRLEALNPLAVLSRGYAVVTQKKSGRLVGSVQQARAGDSIEVRVADGRFGARVTDET